MIFSAAGEILLILADNLIGMCHKCLCRCTQHLVLRIRVQIADLSAHFFCALTKFCQFHILSILSVRSDIPAPPYKSDASARRWEAP